MEHFDDTKFSEENKETQLGDQSISPAEFESLPAAQFSSPSRSTHSPQNKSRLGSILNAFVHMPLLRSVFWLVTTVWTFTCSILLDAFRYLAIRKFIFSLFQRLRPEETAVGGPICLRCGDDVFEVTDGGDLSLHIQDDESLVPSEIGISVRVNSRHFTGLKLSDRMLSIEDLQRLNSILPLDDEMEENNLHRDIHRPCPDAIEEVFGNVHSVESMSAIDGPGLRYLVFLQGCPRRCMFCGNPDTWAKEGGTSTSSKEIIKRVETCRAYLEPNGGGITLSGGEPLYQPKFVSAIFREAHAMGLSTCLDTTGWGSTTTWDKVLSDTDIVLLCLKSFNPQKYKKLTGTPQRSGFQFAEELEKRGVKFWLRYVMLTGYTDGEDELGAMEAFIKSHDSCVGLEILPYHKLGVEKWHQLGKEYPLEGMEPPPMLKVLEVKRRFESFVKVFCPY